jgi:hypothetical protein
MTPRRCRLLLVPGVLLTWTAFAVLAAMSYLPPEPTWIRQLWVGMSAAEMNRVLGKREFIEGSSDRATTRYVFAKDGYLVNVTISRRYETPTAAPRSTVSEVTVVPSETAFGDWLRRWLAP